MLQSAGTAARANRPARRCWPSRCPRCRATPGGAAGAVRHPHRRRFPDARRRARPLAGGGAKSGLFIFTDGDLKFDTPQIEVKIDAAKANTLGITMQDIGGTLATFLGGNYVNRFSLYGRSYEVIPQAPREFRLDADWLTRYQLRTASGALIPLSNVVQITREDPAQRPDLVPANEFRHAVGRALSRPHHRRGAGLPESQGGRDFPGRLYLRFPGREPAIHAGGQYAGARLRLLADRHLSWCSPRNSKASAIPSSS